MISAPFITAWTTKVAWSNRNQIEQDLILSRALITIFNDPVLSRNLAFRGGTALHKIFLTPPGRYSEDIDLCRTTNGGAGPLIARFREILTPWLGQPRLTATRQSLKLVYRFQSESEPPAPMRVKVEVNVRETFNLFGLRNITYQVENPWFAGTAEIRTYSVEEILATKLRALYQRSKGRDLFDLYMALTRIDNLNVDQIIEGFAFYMQKMNLEVSRKDFEANLDNKEKHLGFRDDIVNLLPAEQNYDFDTAMLLVREEIISSLP